MSGLFAGLKWIAILLFIAFVFWAMTTGGKKRVSGFMRNLNALRLPALPALNLAALGASAWVKLAAIPVVIGLIWGGIAFIKHQGRLEERLANERANTQVAELETRVAQLSAELAQNTARDARRVDRVLREAEEDITHAVEAVDPDALFDVYVRSYERVWDDLAPAGESDPGARGPAPVRGPRPGSV